MENEEYNLSIRKLIAHMKFAHIYSGIEIDEELGNWDELLENREEKKETFDLLLSALDEDLSDDNKRAISELRKKEYPNLLCSLGKCYIAKERYSDAKHILHEALSYQFAGAKTLLGIAYFEGRENMSDIQDAFNFLIAEDALSEDARKHIDNDRFVVAAQHYLSAIYRIQKREINSSYNILLRVLESDISEEMKETTKEELSHYKKGFLGRLTYVE